MKSLSLNSLISKIKTKKTFLAVSLLVFLLVGGTTLAVYYLKPLISSKLIQKSSADLIIENKQLKVNFNIVSEDQRMAASFINNLGADSKIIEGLSLDLDDGSIVKLKTVLPVHLTLDISSNRLGFSTPMLSRNLSLPKLNSGVVGDTTNFSTGSGKLSISAKANALHLEAEDPSPLLKYATESGQLHLSRKLDSLFPIFNKVGRIRLDVAGKSVSGVIELK